MFKYNIKYNTIYKIVYPNCFILFLQINNLNKLDTNITLQNFFFKKILIVFINTKTNFKDIYNI